MSEQDNWIEDVWNIGEMFVNASLDGYRELVGAETSLEREDRKRAERAEERTGRGRVSDVVFAEKPAIGGDIEQSPIGVPPGYATLSGLDADYFSRGGIGPSTPGRLGIIEPTYFEGDDWLPASRPAEQVAELQRRMAKAGVLTGKYRLGVWDDASRAAYRDVLGFANASGLSDEDAISRWGEAEKAAGEQERFQKLAFRTPDRATLRQGVKRTFKEMLGRDLRDHELEFLAGQFQTFLEQEHNAEQDARRAAFDAEVSEAAVVDAGPEVDADARFREMLEQRYKPEMQFNQAKEQQAEEQAFIGQSLSRLGSMITPGP